MNKDSITSQVCPDKEMNGVCTKGAECPICNKENPKESKPQEEGNLNIHAATYVPKKKKVPEKLNFNLQAKEFVPKIAVSSNCTVEVQFDEYGMPYIVNTPEEEPEEENKQLSFDDMIDLVKLANNGAMPKQSSSPKKIENDDDFDSLIDMMKGANING